MAKRGMAAAHQALGLRRADGDARIERDDARRVRQQRVDVDLRHLRQVGGELRQAHEDFRHLGAVHRRHVAIAGHLPGDAGARDHVAGNPHVERRQRQRAVLDQFHRLAAAAEQHGTQLKVGSSARPTMSSMAPGDAPWAAR